jgi:hypothetical protein
VVTEIRLPYDRDFAVRVSPHHNFFGGGIFGDGLKLALVNAANGANPVLGQICETSAGFSFARVTFRRIIDIPADGAAVFGHAHPSDGNP